MKTNLLIFFAVLGLASSVHAQYPRISPDITAEAQAKQAAADRRSEEAFAKALPIIKEWEAKGKTYLPGAGEPKDLPQAKVPALPGDRGGGMYSFAARGGT